jgi:hypothetical protein
MEAADLPCPSQPRCSRSTPGSRVRPPGSRERDAAGRGDRAERKVSRIEPAIDEVGAALLREFGELLSRTLAPNASARLKNGSWCALELSVRC